MFGLYDYKTGRTAHWAYAILQVYRNVTCHVQHFNKKAVIWFNWAGRKFTAVVNESTPPDSSCLTDMSRAKNTPEYSINKHSIYQVQRFVYGINIQHRLKRGWVHAAMCVCVCVPKWMELLWHWASSQHVSLSLLSLALSLSSLFFRGSIGLNSNMAMHLSCQGERSIHYFFSSSLEDRLDVTLSLPSLSSFL